MTGIAAGNSVRGGSSGCRDADGVEAIHAPYGDLYCRGTPGQGFTLVHYSDQHKRSLWDRGCMHRLLEGCSRGHMLYQRVSRLCFV